MLFPKTLYPALELLAGNVSVVKAVPSGRVFVKVKDAGGEYNLLARSGYCACQEYAGKCLTEQIFMCRHMIASNLALYLEGIQKIEVDDEEFGLLYKGMMIKK